MRTGLSAEYTKGDHEFRNADPYALAKYRMTLDWLGNDLKAGALLYNIGAGGGYFNRLASSVDGLKIVACEPDPDAYLLAREDAPAGCEVLPYGLQQFADDRGPADVVVMHDVLEHIEDDGDAARTLHSLVTAEGTAIVSVPALMSLFGLHDEALGHFRRYTRATLRSVLEPYFVVERLQWFGMASIPIAWYFSRIRRTPYPAVGTQSRLGAIYAKVCNLESFIAEPIGTSLVARLRPR